jgi:hypothetical protein
VFFREASSIVVPYSFFKAQVDAGNVEDVTSVGDAIQGRFKTNVTYPPPKAGTPPGQPHSPDQPGARTSTEFKTQRPIFADQDLERRLADQGGGHGCRRARHLAEAAGQLRPDAVAIAAFV